ncbi:MAG: hypothetical protein GYA50_10130 [Eubacteriaceae bacterium]|nr:hypothetical protein [Eubacteriaceae bacterium]
MRITFDMMPKEKLAEIVKKGAEASVIVRKHKKAIREIAHTLFNENISQRNILEQIKDAGYEGEFSYEEILVLKLFQRALSNHPKWIDSFRVVRFLAGESDAKRMKIRKRIKW